MSEKRKPKKKRKQITKEDLAEVLLRMKLAALDRENDELRKRQ